MEHEPKIMVFTERIKDWDIVAIGTPVKETMCFMCYNIKLCKYSIFDPAVFVGIHPICDKCASYYYGDAEVRCADKPNEIIPHDPLLDYLNEIDPIEQELKQ